MRYVTLAGLGILGLVAWTSSPADASPLGATVPSLEAAPSYTQVARRVVRRTTVHRGPARTTVRTTTWRRPAHYRWRPGGAIAAGAAIGLSAPRLQQHGPERRLRRAIAGTIGMRAGHAGSGRCP